MAKSSTFSFAFLSEILSSPRIKPFTLRLHPSTVLGALKGAFDDASQELLSAIGEQRRPDFNDLIEKIVRRLSEIVDFSEPLVLDARGRIFPNDVERLAPAALEESAWTISEPQTDYSRRVDALREKDVVARLAQLAASESAAFFPSAETARVAVLQSLLAKGRGLVVARRDMCERENGERLEDAFRFFPDLVWREVGACNSARLEDYDRALDASIGLVWRAFGRWSLEGPRALATDLAKLKNPGAKRDFVILGDLEFAPLLDLSEFFDAAIPTIAERLQSGFDLILCDGAQLIGGPNCGLLFGSRAAIRDVLATPIARVAKMNRVAICALAKTLSLCEVRANALESIPALRMLSASIANLSSRASRLAALLDALDEVQFARSIEGRSTLCANASFGSSPTRLVELRPRGCSPAELARRLESGSPKLLVRWTRDVILLDVKTLAPECDAIVVESIEKALTPTVASVPAQ